MCFIVQHVLQQCDHGEFNIFCVCTYLSEIQIFVFMLMILYFTGFGGFLVQSLIHVGNIMEQYFKDSNSWDQLEACLTCVSSIFLFFFFFFLQIPMI